MSYILKAAGRNTMVAEGLYYGGTHEQYERLHRFAPKEHAKRFSTEQEAMQFLETRQSLFTLEWVDD